jgi:cytochrome c-type biogenesis protein CcmH
VKLLLFLMLVLQSQLLLANVEVVEFSDESLRPRYQQLIEELRCPKCQNQSLADSNSPISNDLRAQVQRLLEEDLSDQQIKDYLVARYSDFILYRPEVNQTTWLLWGSPLVFVLLGLLVVYRLYFKQRPSESQSHSQSQNSDQISPEDQQRLDSLLTDREPK